MVKKPRKTIDMEFVPLSVRLSLRDNETLTKLSIQDRTNKTGVIKEAIDALREKRAYAAKRSIERPFGPRQLDLILDDDAFNSSRVLPM